jgi:predicted RNA-binding Zn ribbon-like protein
LHFAPDTEASLEFVVVLANTDASASKSGADELATLEQLAALIVGNGYSGRMDHDDAELREVQQTRAILRELWTLERDDAAVEVNEILRVAGALPFLVRHDELDWHLHATSPDAPLAERIQVEASLALSDVIRMDEMDRLRVCDAPDCEGLFMDLSRNGSKRFCSVRCGNRVNMIAFRERKAERG